MNKISLTIFCVLMMTAGIFAQTPTQFSYQAALRNLDGSIMANEAVSVDISLLYNSATGTEVFTETHDVTTSEQGIINLTVGSVEDMSAVSWSAGDYFIKVSVNGTEMGTSQILSVPYALHSKTAKIAENAYWMRNTSNNIYYSGNNVGVGTSTPNANFQVVGGAKIGTNGLVTEEVIEITGTTSSTASSISVSYPSGYTQDNTRILDVQVKYLGATWMGIGKHFADTGSIAAGLGLPNIYLYYPDDSSFKSKPYRIVLMKVQ